MRKIPFLLFFCITRHRLTARFYLNIWVAKLRRLHDAEPEFSQTFNNLFTDENRRRFIFADDFMAKDNDSIFFARLFSMNLLGARDKDFFDLARKIGKTNARFFVSAFFALHPFLFWASSRSGFIRWLFCFQFCC